MSQIVLRRFALIVENGYPLHERATWESTTEALGVEILGQPGFWILHAINNPLVPLPPPTPPTVEFGEIIDIGSGPDFTNFDLYAVPLPAGVTPLADYAAYEAALAAYEAGIGATSP